MPYQNKNPERGGGGGGGGGGGLHESPFPSLVPRWEVCVCLYVRGFEGWRTLYGEAMLAFLWGEPNQIQNGGFHTKRTLLIYDQAIQTNFIYWLFNYLFDSLFPWYILALFVQVVILTNAMFCFLYSLLLFFSFMNLQLLLNMEPNSFICLG